MFPASNVEDELVSRDSTGRYHAHRVNQNVLPKAPKPILVDFVRKYLDAAYIFHAAHRLEVAYSAPELVAHSSPRKPFNVRRQGPTIKGGQHQSHRSPPRLKLSIPVLKHPGQVRLSDDAQHCLVEFVRAQIAARPPRCNPQPAHVVAHHGAVHWLSGCEQAFASLLQFGLHAYIREITNSSLSAIRTVNINPVDFPGTLKPNEETCSASETFLPAPQ